MTQVSGRYVFTSNRLDDVVYENHLFGHRSDLKRKRKRENLTQFRFDDEENRNSLSEISCIYVNSIRRRQQRASFIHHPYDIWVNKDIFISHHRLGFYCRTSLGPKRDRNGEIKVVQLLGWTKTFRDFLLHVAWDVRLVLHDLHIGVLWKDLRLQAHRVGRLCRRNRQGW